jgi:hypothetical protein
MCRSFSISVETSPAGLGRLKKLKWRVQPALRGNRRRLSVREQRRRINRVMSQNPGLGAEPDAALCDDYGDALLMAERETGLLEATFPAVCPWTFEQIVDADFWPDATWNACAKGIAAAWTIGIRRAGMSAVGPPSSVSGLSPSECIQSITARRIFILSGRTFRS